MKYSVKITEEKEYCATISKRMTLKDRNELQKEIKKLKENLQEAFNVKTLTPVLINLELGYENQQLDVYIGFEVEEKECSKIPENMKSLTGFDKLLVHPYRGTSKLPILSIVCPNMLQDIEEGYTTMIEYAKNYHYQMCGWFKERYIDSNWVEITIEVKDLNKKKDNVKRRCGFV